ncbi:hypothetical protein MJ561_00555 [Klebsiella pneumoniae]|nr:hypothetical protein MJ561_00555 [Klebsiella pneumoniae]
MFSKLWVQATSRKTTVAGEDFRRELVSRCHARSDLTVRLVRECRYRCEFGGFFPVQVRFSPAHCHFDVAVCSPGELSDRYDRLCDTCWPAVLCCSQAWKNLTRR